ncbi:MAG: hypothetical protein K8R73_00505 [Clostridiales bacterium]|nr:hypothetical protein [Clostridiales bacterium]
MKINNNIIKHYLKNVLFINGTAYAGKSTMVSLLAEKYGLIECGENYHFKFAGEIVNVENQPNMCYFQTMKDWQEFVNRTPDEYEKWISGVEREVAELEVVELIRMSQNQKVIVDTNISIDILREIADYHQVAIMLTSHVVSEEKFFDRKDADKAFLKEKILEAEDPEKTMANFKSCIARVNSKEKYDDYLNSGFFTLIRNDTDVDTKAEILDILATHFKLKST